MFQVHGVPQLSDDALLIAWKEWWKCCFEWTCKLTIEHLSTPYQSLLNLLTLPTEKVNRNFYKKTCSQLCISWQNSMFLLYMTLLWLECTLNLQIPPSYWAWIVTFMNMIKSAPLI